MMQTMRVAMTAQTQLLRLPVPGVWEYDWSIGADDPGKTLDGSAVFSLAWLHTAISDSF